MMEWWHSITFLQKGWLWGLLIIPALILYWWYQEKRPGSALKFSSVKFFAGARTPAAVKWKPVLYVLQSLAILLTILAMARPQSKLEWRKTSGEGIDIMLSIDVSPSMSTADFLPNRLEAAKTQAVRFIDNRPDDRIGVVVFSGEAFTICPLTTDHEALKALVRNLELGSLDMGTAIGMGLAKAVERLQESTAKSKVVILLTDGENNSGMISPEDAARLAKTFKVKIYTIGMGAQGEEVLQPTQVNPDGSYVQSYQPVNIDEKMLMEMAQSTGGLYFRASDNLKLEQIYNEINKLERSAFDKQESQQRKEEYFPLLIAALLILMIEQILKRTFFSTLT